MGKFTSTDGKQYEINLSIFDLKLVRGELDIDLGNLHSGDPPLLTKLDQDVALLMDVIYVLVREQASNNNLDEISWAKSMGGKAATDARRVFWEALVDFFRQYGRKDVVTSVQKLLAITESYIEMGSQELEDYNIENEVEATRTKLREMMKERQSLISGALSTNGRESSDSTPILSAPES